jgi:hypothetical protein
MALKESFFSPKMSPLSVALLRLNRTRPNESYLLAHPVSGAKPATLASSFRGSAAHGLGG